VTYDTRAFETLGTMAQRFSSLTRPQIILSGPDTLETDLHKAAGGSVLFNAIIGRNIFSRCDDKASFIKRMHAMLVKTGVIVLAETVHSASQRLSGTIRCSDPALLKKLKKAEQSLFSDPQNSMVNWTVESLKMELEKHGVSPVRISETAFDTIRRISAPDVEFWLRETGEGEKKSLGDHIREITAEEEFEEIRKTLHAQLDNTDIVWKSVVAFVVIHS